MLEQSTSHPYVQYEDLVYVRTGYDTERSDDPSERYIEGYEQIDTHVEDLLETWENTGDLKAAIDVLTIISKLPDHFQSVPNTLYEQLIQDIFEDLKNHPSDDEAHRLLMLHITQLEPLYDYFEHAVRLQLENRTTSLDEVIRAPLSRAFLDAYAELNLPPERQGVMEAVYHFLTTCKTKDSAL